MRLLSWITLMAAMLAGATALAAPSDVGLVLMHGKWSAPKAPGVRIVAEAASAQGYRVANIQMPWSRNREYDRDYPEALAEIDDAVAQLKASGVRKIVVIGHSFGANASLAYASQREGVDGIVLMAPGHSPDYQQSTFAPSVSKAASMITDGKGEEMAAFEDSNQGKSKTIRTRARVYHSYFAPSGLGAMSVTAPQVRPGTAVLLVIGNSDPWASRAKAVIFDKVPSDPRSRYIEIRSNHADTPKDGLAEILRWLSTFE